MAPGCLEVPLETGALLLSLPQPRQAPNILEIRIILTHDKVLNNPLTSKSLAYMGWLGRAQTHIRWLEKGGQ